jgi:hypothetical protein
MANGIADLVRAMMRPDRAADMVIVLPQTMQVAMNTDDVAGICRQKNKLATTSMIMMSKSMTSETIWSPIQLTT